LALYLEAKGQPNTTTPTSSPRVKVFDLAESLGTASNGSNTSLAPWKRYRFVLRTQAEEPSSLRLTFEGSSGAANGSTIALDNVSLTWRQLMLSSKGQLTGQSGMTTQGSTGDGSSNRTRNNSTTSSDIKTSTRASKFLSSTKVPMTSTPSPWWSWWDEETEEDLSTNETSAVSNQINSGMTTSKKGIKATTPSSPWWSWWDEEPQNETSQSRNSSSFWENDRDNRSTTTNHWWFFDSEDGNNSSSWREEKNMTIENTGTNSSSSHMTLDVLKSGKNGSQTLVFHNEFQILYSSNFTINIHLP